MDLDHIARLAEDGDKYAKHYLLVTAANLLAADPVIPDYLATAVQATANAKPLLPKLPAVEYAIRLYIQGHPKSNSANSCYTMAAARYHLSPGAVRAACKRYAPDAISEQVKYHLPPK